MKLIKSELLKEFLNLEKRMLHEAKLQNEQQVEDLCDQLDTIWYKLSDEDINFLNSRKGDNNE